MVSTTSFDLKISPVAPGHSSRLSSSTSTTHRNLHAQHVAAFEGTFAPDARPPFDPVSKPWYRDQDYFWGGWADKSVWKSAVRSSPFFILFVVSLTPSSSSNASEQRA
jgi:hypothetical protein